MANDAMKFRSQFWSAIMALEAEANKYEMRVFDATTSDEAKSSLKLYRKTVKHLERVRAIVQFHEEHLEEGAHAEAATRGDFLTEG